MDPNNFMIRFCHNMHWYAKDVARFFSSDSSKQKTLDEMLDSMQPILEGKNAEAAKLLA
jgi:hypothetical protein